MGINLGGTLNLMGNLTFEGGKLTVDSVEALVETSAPADAPQCTAAAPVIMPPPPGAPSDPAPTVWIVNSFNKTVKAGTRAVVAQGMAMQGSTPTWPGMVLPGSATVTINHIPINVVGDKATIFPSGGAASFTVSGQ